MIAFDELHVISDLHLGGSRKETQIFDCTAELAGLIDHLRGLDAKREVALVINGDFVDFLAEPGARYLDPEGAIGKLDRIWTDDTFAPIWEALKSFVAKNNRHLVINIGNHDLELALPHVRRHLIERLCGGKDAARGRVHLVLDGAGFTAQVGQKRVLCVHGNEVDTWNVTDHEQLRRTCSDQEQRRTIHEWTPNAGTKLVIDVMNDIKCKYRFVDLLKPEVKAVVPILLALDNSKAASISAVAAVGARLGWDKVRRMTGFLSHGETPPSDEERTQPEPKVAGVTALDRLLRETLPSPGTTDGAEALLDDAEKQLKAGRTPFDMTETGADTEMLGYWGAAWNRLTGRPMHEVLFEAIQYLKEDDTFQPTTPDDTFRRLDPAVGDFDFVIAGHTHLEKVLSRACGGGIYYNTGTWARLIRIEPKHLESVTAFKHVFDAVAAGTMAALDAAEGLVKRRPAVASIWTAGDNVESALHRVECTNTGIKLTTTVGI